MNVLVVGSGGREHALVWKIRQSSYVETVYCCPGNGGMTGMDGVTCIPDRDYAALADFAGEHDVELTVVGPEAPLCDGIVDVFRGRNLRIFGPTKAAAQLEGSKIYAKAFMNRYGIPTPEASVCTSLEQAEEALTGMRLPVVVKADGLAGGKGVTVATDRNGAAQAVRHCFEGGFGEAGKRVLLEECLQGREASIIAFTDGRSIVPLATSQDHKRIGDGDTGANTGGMGAYSPAPVIDDEAWNAIGTQILTPFLEGARKEGLDYRGVIYAGIMLTEQGPRVLEFNVRFGDPETQAILPRLQSDLTDVLKAAVDGELEESRLEWVPEAAVCVVLAEDGYPGSYEKGHPITGIADAEAKGALVFHAGTKFEDSRIKTAGGRVLGVTHLGANLHEAAENVYDAVDCIRWTGKYYRTDIARAGS